VKEAKDMRIYHNVIEKFPEASFLKTHNAFSYCGFPSLDINGEVVSVTCLLDDKPHEFSDKDKDLLQIFAQRIGLEMERKKYLTERKQAESREKLDIFTTTFSRACRDFTELKPVLELATAGLAEQLHVSRASVWFLDDSGNLACQKLYEYPKSIYSEGMVLYSKNYPNYIKAILNDSPIDAHDARTDPRTSEFLNNYLLPPNIFSILDVPIKIEGKVSGVLCLEQTSYSRHWQKHEIDFADTITAQLSNAIDRITEHKQAEDTISKLSFAVEQSPNTIIITDINANIEYVNPIFTKITGYTSEEAVGQNPRILKSGKTPPEVYKKLWKAIKSGNEWRGEFINKKKNGELYTESVYIAPIKNTEGVSTHFVAVKEDITERKKIEEELLKMQKLESVGVLAGGIAHDFNNSLQAILSSITVAKLYLNPEDEVYKRLTDAEKVTIQSKGLSQQLLTFSRGGDPIRKTIFISELIKNSAQFALSGSNVRCEFEIPDNLWSVKADKGQLDQVISNICINANQSTTLGRTINVKAENYNLEVKDSLPLQEGKYVKITIKDQGIGIPTEYLQKIFDPYFTTKQKGSGLGLATCYSIIKKHNGYIDVESEVGIGTIFHIYLPASQIEVRQEPILDKAKVESTEEASITCKGKILLMDDEDVIRLAVTQHLRNLKYEVEAVRDGTEAIKLYKKAIESGKSFDAVVMDLTIPGDMGGKEATKRLLEIDPKTKVIVASGYVNDPIMAEFKKHGFKGVLTKPYEIDELDEVLQKVIMEKGT
jgi:PAS domain S-box-containing protein